MKVSRRDFLKYCLGSAAALGLDLSLVGSLEKALATGGAPPIIWLNGANCTGCTVSLANLVSSSKNSGPVDVADLLINTIDLAFHPNLMGAAGDLAVQKLTDTAKGDYILVVDGGIPTAFGGRACMVWTEDGRDVTALEAVKILAPGAKKVLCVGTCASFGGIPGGEPNPTRIKSVSAVSGVRTINIPGCPAHPDWVVGTLVRLLAGVSPVLDSSNRPKIFFGSTVHDQCPFKGEEELPSDHPRVKGACSDCHNDEMEGKAGCLAPLGCKGPTTGADCPKRLWNNGTNWCIGANAICLGCTEKGFPDKFSPFYSGGNGIQGLPPKHPKVTGTCSKCHDDGKYD